MTSVPLPSELDPRNALAAGARVLENGLPILPDILTHQMSIPIASWTTASCAVVAFLRFHPSTIDREITPMITTYYYVRNMGTWEARPGWYGGSKFAFDPVVEPWDERDLGGRDIVYGQSTQSGELRPGHPACVATGRVSPAVTSIAVVQGDVVDRRLLHSHFGAWVVCTEEPGPFSVRAFGKDGAAIAELRHPLSVPSRGRGSSPG